MTDCHLCDQLERGPTVGTRLPHLHGCAQQQCLYTGCGPCCNMQAHQAGWTGSRGLVLAAGVSRVGCVRCALWSAGEQRPSACEKLLVSFASCQMQSCSSGTMACDVMLLQHTLWHSWASSGVRVQGSCTGFHAVLVLQTCLYSMQCAPDHISSFMSHHGGSFAAGALWKLWQPCYGVVRYVTFAVDTKGMSPSRTGVKGNASCKCSACMLLLVVLLLLL
jgi:hypothetical protein